MGSRKTEYEATGYYGPQLSDDAAEKARIHSSAMSAIDPQVVYYAEEIGRICRKISATHPEGDQAKLGVVYNEASNETERSPWVSDLKSALATLTFSRSAAKVLLDDTIHVSKRVPTMEETIIKCAKKSLLLDVFGAIRVYLKK